MVCIAQKTLCKKLCKLSVLQNVILILNVLLGKQVPVQVLTLKLGKKKRAERNKNGIIGDKREEKILLFQTKIKENAKLLLSTKEASQIED